MAADIPDQQQEVGDLTRTGDSGPTDSTEESPRCDHQLLEDLIHAV